MAKTQISDIIVPEVFAPYVVTQIKQRNRFFQSGLVQDTDNLVPSKGKVMNFPMWNEIGGDSEVLSDSASLTSEKITTDEDVAVINFRGKSWSTNDLAELISGTDDILGTMSQFVADYWVRVYDRVLTNTAKGAIAGADTALGGGVLVNDVSAASPSNLTRDVALDTVQLQGEHQNEITTVVMHSAVRTQLLKQDEIDFIPDSQQEAVLESYLGYNVLVDDNLTADSGTYTTIFAKPGAFGFAENTPDNIMVETDRDVKAGDDILTTRQRFVIHPNGIAWSGSPSGASPTNSELSTAGNWSNVFTNPEKVGFVAAKHTLT